MDDRDGGGDGSGGSEADDERIILTIKGKRYVSPRRSTVVSVVR